MFPTLGHLVLVGVTLQGTLHTLANIQYPTLINILPYKNLSLLKVHPLLHIQFPHPKLFLTEDKHIS